MAKKGIVRGAAGFLLFLGLWVFVAPLPAAHPATVSGKVMDAAGPVAGAVVRQRATRIETRSAADGSFTLSGVPEGSEIMVTAWAEGYYPDGAEVTPPAGGVTIRLKLHPDEDNPDHEWLTSMPDPAKPLGCGHCMVAFPQWVKNAHGLSAVNKRFFSLYNGTDLGGSRRLGGGYQDDFPGTAGNCANCHAPGMAANRPFTADMNRLSGVEKEGVFCDFCHKVAGVYLDPGTGRPYPNAPGTQSMRLNRPPSDTHMFYGPFDDVVRRVSYLELEKKSQFCAPCHQFSFWGTPIYESFREWQESPYPAMGIECQGCHMVPTGVDYFVYPEKGGFIREPGLIASHLQPGAADAELLQNTVTLEVAAREAGDFIAVTAAIRNTGAGHHVPTDYPGRHMILTVSGQDEAGRPLGLRSGPSVPGWGGAQAGRPGKAFAKVLRDVKTGEKPVVTYWKQTLIDSDNRIPAMASDLSSWVFAKPDGAGSVTVRAELIFRRVFQQVLDTRGWDTPDIVMEREEGTVAVSPPFAAGIVPDVKVNGSDSPLSLASGEEVAVSVGVAVDAAAVASPPPDADWWIGVYTPSYPPYEWFGLREFGGWDAGVFPFRQGPLSAMPRREVLRMDLPAGIYYFFAAVDANRDGRADATWFDFVQVEVQ